MYPRYYLLLYKILYTGTRVLVPGTGVHLYWYWYWYWYYVQYYLVLPSCVQCTVLVLVTGNVSVITVVYNRWV